MLLNLNCSFQLSLSNQRPDSFVILKKFTQNWGWQKLLRYSVKTFLWAIKHETPQNKEKMSFLFGLKWEKTFGKRVAEKHLFRGCVSKPKKLNPMIKLSKNERKAAQNLGQFRIFGRKCQKGWSLQNIHIFGLIFFRSEYKTVFSFLVSILNFHDLIFPPEKFFAVQYWMIAFWDRWKYWRRFLTRNAARNQNMKEGNFDTGKQKRSLGVTNHSLYFSKLLLNPTCVALRVINPICH